jgi:hypothetical protein
MNQADATPIEVVYDPQKVRGPSPANPPSMCSHMTRFEINSAATRGESPLFLPPIDVIRRGKRTPFEG